jgi:hypothetical protein
VRMGRKTRGLGCELGAPVRRELVFLRLGRVAAQRSDTRCASGTASKRSGVQVSTIT